MNIMRNFKSARALVLLPATLLAAACGNSDDASSSTVADKSIESAADASVTDMGLDASTADAMSVDVAAGGVAPMAASTPAAPTTAPAAATAEPAATPPAVEANPAVPQ